MTGTTALLGQVATRTAPNSTLNTVLVVIGTYLVIGITVVVSIKMMDRRSRVKRPTRVR